MLTPNRFTELIRVLRTSLDEIDGRPFARAEPRPAPLEVCYGNNSPWLSWLWAGSCFFICFIQSLVWSRFEWVRLRLASGTFRDANALTPQTNIKNTTSAYWPRPQDVDALPVYNHGLAVTTLDRLRHWNQTGIITDLQYQMLAALVREERFSFP